MASNYVPVPAELRKREQHGKWNTPEHRVWTQIRQRCLNPKNKHYIYYGGRGITICERWHRFTAFMEDMGPRPDGMTVERIDTNKGYEPENCRWATWDEQRHNKRNNRWFTFNGKTLILADWARELGVSKYLLSSRIDNYGWSVERAFSEPAGTRKKSDRILLFRGEALSMVEWCRRLGLNYALVKHRLRPGSKNPWTIERALTTVQVQT